MHSPEQGNDTRRGFLATGDAFMPRQGTSILARTCSSLVGIAAYPLSRTSAAIPEIIPAMPYAPMCS